MANLTVLSCSIFTRYLGRTPK